MKRLYLTFDDGPHPVHTPQVLDLLGRHGATATFFVVGQNVRQHPHLVRREVADGHSVQNHSYTHPHLPELSQDRIAQELRQTNSAIKSQTRTDPTCFRPPYGDTNQVVVRQAEQHGLTQHLWSIDTMDWSPDSTPQSIIDVVRRAVAADAVILMHDGVETSGNTIAALRTLLQWLSDQGYALSSIC